MLHIWTLYNWEKYYNEDSVRTGLRLRFDKDVNPEVKRACKEFCAWLRKEYYFPIRIPIYIKAQDKVKASDGDLVYGHFRPCINKNDEPYISIAVGDYSTLIKKWGVDDTLSTILRDIAHELTHYFQWINDIKLTPIGEERQATMYSNYIMDDYKDTREHP